MIKYIVTDPCYILPDEVWQECCRLLDNGTQEDFNKAVCDALIHYTGYKAWVSQTGFGDWSNLLYGEDIIQREFLADSGMVCVCRHTPLIEKFFKDKHSEKLFALCVAVFEMSENIDVILDMSQPRWTHITITDKDTNKVITALEWAVPEDEDDT